MIFIMLQNLTSSVSKHRHRTLIYRNPLTNHRREFFLPVCLLFLTWSHHTVNTKTRLHNEISLNDNYSIPNILRKVSGYVLIFKPHSLTICKKGFDVHTLLSNRCTSNSLTIKTLNEYYKLHTCIYRISTTIVSIVWVDTDTLEWRRHPCWLI